MFVPEESGVTFWEFLADLYYLSFPFSPTENTAKPHSWGSCAPPVNLAGLSLDENQPGMAWLPQSPVFTDSADCVCPGPQSADEAVHL